MMYTNANSRVAFPTSICNRRSNWVSTNSGAVVASTGIQSDSAINPSCAWSWVIVRAILLSHLTQTVNHCLHLMMLSCFFQVQVHISNCAGETHDSWMCFCVPDFNSCCFAFRNVVVFLWSKVTKSIH